MGWLTMLQVDTVTVALAAVTVTIIVGRVIMRRVKNPPPGASSVPFLGSYHSVSISSDFRYCMSRNSTTRLF